MIAAARSRGFAVAAALVALLAVAAYSGVSSNDFITLDDGDYITQNVFVRQGLTAHGTEWALTTGFAGNWHPLTWLSHMLDVQLFGVRASAHHLVGLTLHALNALLLLLLLRALTGALWRSALVAAVFAVHPQHVESVAWAAERKDVLAQLFTLATALEYVRAARRNAVPRSWALPLLYALALMAKPMPVTLPFVFLLLDGWPLGRWATPQAGAPAGPSGSARWLPPASLWLEKTLLFVMAAGSAAMTMRMQSQGIMREMPMFDRIGTALLAVAHYLAKIAWPVNLSAFYPFAPPLALPVTAAGLLVAALSAVALWRARRQPFLLTGWLWFLGTLVPVVGFVKVGSQSWADRYTYLPAIGIYVALVWGASAALARRPRLVPASWAVAATLLLLLAARTRDQVTLWKDDFTLFTHTLRIDPGNWVAHNSIGLHFLARGRLPEARAEFERALEIQPGYFDALMNMSLVLTDLKQPLEAEGYLRRALEINPVHPNAHHNLGIVLLALGREEEGLGHLQQAISIDPTLELPRINLGRSLILAKRPAEAVPQFEAAIKINPDNVGTYNNLGYALHLAGRNEEALAQLRIALEKSPTLSEAYNNRGLALAALGRHPEAQAAYRAAIALQPGQSEPHFNFALSLEASGDRAGAAEQYREAVRINPGDVEAWQSLIRTLTALGRTAEAAEAAARAGLPAPGR